MSVYKIFKETYRINKTCFHCFSYAFFSLLPPIQIHCNRNKKKKKWKKQNKLFWCNLYCEAYNKMVIMCMSMSMKMKILAFVKQNEWEKQQRNKNSLIVSVACERHSFWCVIVNANLNRQTFIQLCTWRVYLGRCKPLSLLNSVLYFILFFIGNVIFSEAFMIFNSLLLRVILKHKKFLWNLGLSTIRLKKKWSASAKAPKFQEYFTALNNLNFQES